MIAHALAGLAAIELHSDPIAAVRVLGCIDAIHCTLGLRTEPLDYELRQHTANAAHSLLDAATFHTAWDAGQRTACNIDRHIRCVNEAPG